MDNTKYVFEKDFNDLPFLNVCKPEQGEHYEVSQYSMKVLFDEYEYYKDNYNEPIKRSMCKPIQISSKGYSISRKEKYYDDFEFMPCINVACDVLTGLKAFTPETNIGCFKTIYHTAGNFLPIPEGANFSPGTSGKIGNSDSYEQKLSLIKKLFEEKDIISEKEIKHIKARIEIGFGLGSSTHLDKIQEANEKLKIQDEYQIKLEPLTNNIQLRYWIQNEWKKNNKNWKDYVEANYLHDFVDMKTEDWLPLSFDSSDPVQACKLIIKRGYRIFKKR
ncbi:MAG: hypothetical protein K5931_03970, partial [Lachnospiraceae bacterium]|nr:hypothetical protein [Lachnospiraceae bacterium]